MKIIINFSILVVFILILLTPINTPTPAKPLTVIESSNSYPSGPLYNINIHSKSNFKWDSIAGGNSVFIDVYDDSPISYVTDRKSSITEFAALDKCAEAFDGDPATMQLPYESEGFYLITAVYAKPNNGNTTTESSAILWPNLVIRASNDTNPSDCNFQDYTECPSNDLLELCLIAGNVISKSNFFTSRTGTISLLKARHLLM